MRAILIANHADADGGAVTARFADHHFDFELWTRDRSDEWENLPDDVGLVVSLGSDWSVYWDHVASHVAAEARLLAAATERGTPVFGICFGGQMLAHALGGRVERAPQPEIGWFSVSGWEFIGQNPWFQWHYDRFIPPAGARELATGAQGSQAFLVGNSLGLQFHPEVTPAIVERWSSGAGADELSRIGVDRETLLAATRSHEHVSRDAAHRLVDWFVAHCAEPT